MNCKIAVLILSIIVIALFMIAIYFYMAKKRMVDDISEITKQLAHILDNDTEEKVMLFTVEKSFKELIMQINRILNDRQRIKAEYKEAEISSKKMLSNISHDIKTPLTVILGYLEIMNLNPNKDNDNEMLKKVAGKANQVMELINKFFSLAKIEAGDTNITISKVNLNEICRENIIDFYNILMERDFIVNVEIPDTDFFVYGNIESLNRVISNLINNAIRYGYAGKYLGLALRYDEKNAYVDIVDKGRGIPKELINSVFDRLFTLDDSRNRRLGGNGLGLAIAKSLVEKMNGEIYVVSKPDIKTVFTVKLKRVKY